MPDRLQDAWPYLVFHDAFPLSTVFVNGALDDATVAEAIEAQAPLAAELKPDLVEVWLGADDLRVRTPVAEFTQSLTNLISALRAAGSRRILVADLPTAYGARVAAYNAAIHQVVAGAHAELVPLAATPITLAPNDGLEPQPDAAATGSWPPRSRRRSGIPPQVGRGPARRATESSTHDRRARGRRRPLRRARRRPPNPTDDDYGGTSDDPTGGLLGDDLGGLLRNLQRLVDPRIAVRAAQGAGGAAWRSVTSEEPRVQVTAAIAGRDRADAPVAGAGLEPSPLGAPRARRPAAHRRVRRQVGALGAPHA